MPTIFLNDTPIEALGLVMVDNGPLLGGVPVSRDVQPWPGRAGGLAAQSATIGPRTVRFVADATVTTVAARTAVLDRLSDLLTGLVEVRFDDAPSRVLRGLVSVYEADVPVPPRWVNIAPRVVVEITCPLATRWDAQPTSRVLSATPTDIPVGTAPHGGVIFLTGTAAGALSGEVRLRYRGVSGVILNELVLSASLLAGEFLRIDLDAATLTRVTTAGVESNAYAWRTGGTFFRPAPRDGVRDVSAWPTLELTAGTGLYVFRRQYLT